MKYIHQNKTYGEGRKVAMNHEDEIRNYWESYKDFVEVLLYGTGRTIQKTTEDEST